MLDFFFWKAPQKLGFQVLVSSSTQRGFLLAEFQALSGMCIREFRGHTDTVQVALKQGKLVASFRRGNLCIYICIHCIYTLHIYIYVFIYIYIYTVTHIYIYIYSVGPSQLANDGVYTTDVFFPFFSVGKFLGDLKLDTPLKSCRCLEAFFLNVYNDMGVEPKIGVPPNHPF